MVFGSYSNPELSILVSDSGRQQAIPADVVVPEQAVGAGTLSSYGS